MAPFEAELALSSKRMLKSAAAIAIVILLLPAFSNYRLITNEVFLRLFQLKLQLRIAIAVAMTLVLMASHRAKSYAELVRITCAFEAVWSAFWLGILLITTAWMPESYPQRSADLQQVFFGYFGGMVFLGWFFPIRFKTSLTIGICMAISYIAANTYLGALPHSTLESNSFFLVGTALFVSFGAGSKFESQRNEFILRSELDRSLKLLKTSQDLLKKELAAARQIQQSLLPPPSNCISGLEISALYLPKDELSGDFYGSIEKDGWVYFYLADITSHGIAAAQVTYILKSQIDHILELRSAVSLDVLLQDLASRYGKTGLPLSIAIQMMRYHPDLRTLEYVRCGSPRAVLVSDKGQLKSIPASPAAPLSGTGEVRSQEFQVQSHQLAISESLYVFTDGAYQLRNSDFKMRHFYDLLTGLPQAGWRNCLEAELTRANAGANFDDDLTVLRIRS